MSDSIRKVVPYTTPTGIQIGLLYNPKPEYEQDLNAYALQLALLNFNTEPSLIKKFLRLL
jgi:hypothetical protein